MADKIKYSDFIDSSVKKGIDVLNIALKEVDTTLETLKKNPIKFDELFKAGGGKEFKENEKNIKSIIEATKGLVTLEKSKIELEKQKIVLQKEAAALSKTKEANDKEQIANAIKEEKLSQSKIKTEKDLLLLNEKKAKQTKQAIADEQKQINTIENLTDVLKKEAKTEKELTAQNILLRKAKKDVDFTTKEGIKTINKINAALDKNNAKIRQNADALTKQKINIGNYKSALSGVFNAISPVTLGLTGMVMVFKNIIGISSEFEKQMSKVAAISVATSNEFNLLRDNATKLGESTKFTATEVGTLQEEYAKLGFSTTEILNATSATLDLAAATGESLQSSAVTAGATLRGYGLEATEMSRVVNVMAASFSSSALDLENFTESMKLVAPIAKVANIPIETTTALLGKLADSGLKGSIAGTALKNLLSQLSNENSKLSKSLGFSVKNSDDLQRAFLLLKDRNIDLTEATQLTDERSKAAFLTLIDQADAVGILEQKITGTNAAQEMSAKMMDNLAGDTDKATSALEGLAITIGDAAGPGSRKIVQGFTYFISGLTAEVKELIRIFSLVPLYINGLFSAFSAFRDGLKDTFINTFKNIGNVIAESFNFKKLLTGNFTDFTSAIENLKKPVANFSKNISDAFTKGYNEAKIKSEKIAMDTVAIEKKKNEEIVKLNEEKNKKIEVEDKKVKTSVKKVEEKKPENIVNEAEKQAAKQAEIDKNLFELRKQIGVVGNAELIAQETKDLEERKEFTLLTTEEQEKAKSDIIKKYSQDTADAQLEIEKLSGDDKLALTAEYLGQSAALFKENTIAFKILASAEALISTYLAASKAFAEVPFPFSIVASALITAKGLLNVAKINNVEIAEKGIFKVLDGKRHRDGGVSLGESGIEAESGEGMSIFSRKATNKYGEEIESFTNAINSDSLNDYYSNKLNVLLRKQNGSISQNYFVNNNFDAINDNLDVLTNETKTTNKLLKKFRFFDNRGNMFDIDGNKTVYLN